MIDKLPTATIAHAIQLSVAQVLLLAGVASILSVLTNCLATEFIQRPDRFVYWGFYAEYVSF